MAQILISIEDDAMEHLQKRAARHGQSVEAEIRDIIQNVLKKDIHPAGGLGTAIAGLFEGLGLQEGEQIPELRNQSRHRQI
jgi:plasmid stability protein